MSDELPQPSVWPAVIVVGLPGTGKSTMCKALADLPDLVHTEMGGILRGIDPDTPMGEQVQSYLEKQDFVPDELVLDIWRHHVQGRFESGEFSPKRQTLLLDGVPRTVEQAKVMHEMLQVRAVVFLDVDDEDALVRRLLRRGRQFGRIDDANEQVIRDRIADHRAQVIPVLDCYPSELIARVDAGRTAVAVLADVAKAIAQGLNGD